MIEIPLTGPSARGRVALIDDEDLPVISQYGTTWRIYERHDQGVRGKGPYARTSLKRGGRTITLYMHKVITGWPMTDHADGDGLNNRRSNLRPATYAQNSANRRPAAGSSSRFLGVTWHRKLGKWQATVGNAGKTLYLGVFVTEEEAARARDARAIELQGEYAHLNFPEVTSGG